MDNLLITNIIETKNKEINKLDGIIDNKNEELKNIDLIISTKYNELNNVNELLSLKRIEINNLSIIIKLLYNIILEKNNTTNEEIKDKLDTILLIINKNNNKEEIENNMIKNEFEKLTSEINLIKKIIIDRIKK